LLAKFSNDVEKYEIEANKMGQNNTVTYGRLCGSGTLCASCLFTIVVLMVITEETSDRLVVRDKTDIR